MISCPGGAADLLCRDRTIESTFQGNRGNVTNSNAIYSEQSNICPASVERIARDSFLASSHVSDPAPFFAFARLRLHPSLPSSHKVVVVVASIKFTKNLHNLSILITFSCLFRAPLAFALHEVIHSAPTFRLRQGPGLKSNGYHKTYSRNAEDKCVDKSQMHHNLTINNDDIMYISPGI